MIHNDRIWCVVYFGNTKIVGNAFLHNDKSIRYNGKFIRFINFQFYSYFCPLIFVR